MLLPRALIVSCLIGLLSGSAQAAPALPATPAPYKVPGLQPGGTQVSKSVMEYYDALNWLRLYAKKLEKNHGRRLPETRPALLQIQSDALFLQQKWTEWPRLHPGQSPYSGDVKLDRYFRAVQGAYRQLKELPKSNDEQIVETVKAVAADIHAKAENCRNSADGLGKDIKVTVRTKKGTEEVAGYEVWCAPMALAKFKDEHIRFPKISSPTVFKNFAPGFYMMWVEKENEKMQPVAQTIGGHGEKELEVDLLIPAETDRPR